MKSSVNEKQKQVINSAKIKGWLSKQTSVNPKSYTKMYCLLNQETKTISCWEKDNDITDLSKIRLTIKLDLIFSVEPIDSLEFRLLGPKITHIFRVTTEEQKSNWIKTISLAKGFDQNGDEATNQQKRSPKRDRTLSPNPGARSVEKLALRNHSQKNLKEQNEGLEEMNQELNFENLKCTEKIQALEQELAHKCSELEDFEREFVHIEKKFSEVEREISGRDAKIGDLLKEVALKNQRIERLEDDGIKTQKVIQKLLQEKASLQQKKQEFESLLEAESHKTAILEEEKLKQRTQIESQQSQIRSLTEDLERLRDSISSITSKPLQQSTAEVKLPNEKAEVQQDNGRKNNLAYIEQAFTTFTQNLFYGSESNEGEQQKLRLELQELLKKSPEVSFLGKSADYLNIGVELLRKKLRDMTEENKGLSNQSEELNSEIRASKLELLKIQREARDEKELIRSKVEEFNIVYGNVIKNLFSSDFTRRSSDTSITELLGICEEFKEFQSLIEVHSYLEELISNNEIKKPNSIENSYKELLSKVEDFNNLLYEEIRDALSSDVTPRPHEHRESIMKSLIEEYKPLAKAWDILELVIEKKGESLNNLAGIQLSNEINQQRLISQIQMMMEGKQIEGKQTEVQADRQRGVDSDKLKEKEAIISELKHRVDKIEESITKFSALLGEGLAKNFESSYKEATLGKLRIEAGKESYAKILLGIFTKVAEKVEKEHANNQKNQGALSQQVKNLSEELQKAITEKASLNENLQKFKKKEATLLNTNQLLDTELNQLKKTLVQVEEACNLFSRNVKELFNQFGSEVGARYSLNDRLARMKQIASRIAQIKELEKVFDFLRDSAKGPGGQHANNLEREKLSQTLAIHRSTSDLLYSKQNSAHDGGKFQTPKNFQRKSKLELDSEELELNEGSAKEADPKISSKGSGVNKVFTFNFVQTPTGKQTTPKYVKNSIKCIPTAETFK